MVDVALELLDDEAAALAGVDTDGEGVHQVLELVFQVVARLLQLPT